MNIKKIITYCTRGIAFQYAKLAFFVEKPPVLTVAIAWFMASNQVIPATLRRNNSAKVSDT